MTPNTKGKYEGQMYDVRRMYDLPLRGIFDLRGGQSSIQAKRTIKGAFFLPSYINFTSYIVPSYINFTSYIVPSYIFLAIFLFFLAYMQKKVYLCARKGF